MSSVHAVSFGLSSSHTVTVMTMERGLMMFASRGSTACLLPGLVLPRIEVVQVHNTPLRRGRREHAELERCCIAVRCCPRSEKGEAVGKGDTSDERLIA